jgi:hypothetical protein
LKAMSQYVMNFLLSVTYSRLGYSFRKEAEKECAVSASCNFLIAFLTLNYVSINYRERFWI